MRRWRTEVVSMEARFTCQDCERMFDTRAGLWYHTKCKHESVRNACNQCDKQFTHQGHVVTHIQSIHTYNLYIHKCVKYACNQCDRQYPQERHLRRHVQSVNE